MDEAEADAVVTVNNQPTIRQGPAGSERYWRWEIAVDNAEDAV